MGNNTLTTITGGIGRKEQVNQYKDALVGDILPRNTDGEVEASAGSLGSEATPFSGAFISSDLKIIGVDHSQTVTTTQTFNFPALAYDRKCIIYSNGGAGWPGSYTSGTNKSNAGGGGGGGGCIVCINAVGDTILCTVDSEKYGVQFGDKSIYVKNGTNGGTPTAGNGGYIMSMTPSIYGLLSFFANGGNGGAGATGVNIASGGWTAASAGMPGERGDAGAGGTSEVNAAGGNGALSGGGGGGGRPAADAAGQSGGNGGSLSGRNGGIVFYWKERS